MQIIARDIALAGGMRRYFTGAICCRGHVAERAVRSRRCVVCNKEDAKRFAAENPRRVRETQQRYDKRRRADISVWASHMAASVRNRAKRKSIPYNLTAADILCVIPEDRLCPALGIPLIWGGKLSRNSPSIDRITPSLGYVAGNIAIISHKANSMKQDAIHSDELRRIADWMDSLARGAAGPAEESRSAA